MSYDFNANDILEMAERIEKNGAKFYRDAAGNVSDSSLKELLLDLASMEDNHEKMFAQSPRHFVNALLVKCVVCLFAVLPGFSLV